MMRQAGGGGNTSSPKEDNTDNDMCHIDEDDILLSLSEVKLYSSLMPGSFKSFNPITEPSDEWECKFGGSPHRESNSINLDTTQQIHLPACCSGTYSDGDKELSFPAGPSLFETDDELIKSKIRVFLDGKAIELKKLQTPLYEEFFNSLNAAASPSYVDSTCDETTPRFLKLPPKSRSPSRGPIASPSAAVDVFSTGSPGSNGRCASNVCGASDQTLKDTPSPALSDWKGLRDDAQQEPNSPRFFHEFQAGVGGKMSSPEDQGLNKQRGKMRFADSMSLDWVRVARHKLLLCCWMDILPVLSVLVIGLWGCLFILSVEKATWHWLPPLSLFSVALPFEQLASVSSLPFLMYFFLQ